MEQMEKNQQEFADELIGMLSELGTPIDKMAACAKRELGVREKCYPEWGLTTNRKKEIKMMADIHTLLRKLATIVDERQKPTLF